MNSVNGALLILGVWIVFVTALLVTKQLLLYLPVPKRSIRSGFNTALLSVSALFCTLVLIEIALGIIQEGKVDADDGARQLTTDLVIPEQWKKRPASVPGATNAYYWHNKLHVFNKDNFRNIGDYTLDEQRERIVVLGDSLTYGEGIAVEDTYVAKLEELLMQRYPKRRFTLYNLGVKGNQSEDIARVAEKWLPRLRPQLVIYGICQNDFLHSGIRQYKNNMRFQIPLPKFIKEPLEKRTRIGALLTERYNLVLMKLGLRNDFLDDILKDFNSYQDRFAHDLRSINDIAVEVTGKPVIAMVLDQNPGERGERVAQVAERLARAAGMQVVDTKNYYRKYSKSDIQFRVSRWEGHPNELANQIFAKMFFQHLISSRTLENEKIPALRDKSH